MQHKGDKRQIMLELESSGPSGGCRLKIDLLLALLPLAGFRREPIARNNLPGAKSSLVTRPQFEGHTFGFRIISASKELVFECLQHRPTRLGIVFGYVFQEISFVAVLRQDQVCPGAGFAPKLSRSLSKDLCGTTKSSTSFTCGICFLNCGGVLSIAHVRMCICSPMILLSKYARLPGIYHASASFTENISWRIKGAWKDKSGDRKMSDRKRNLPVVALPWFSVCQNRASKHVSNLHLIPRSRLTIKTHHKHHTQELVRKTFISNHSAI